MPEIQAIYADGDSWLLSKRNNREAVAERHPLDDMAELMRSGVSVAVLQVLGRAARARYTRGSQLGGLPSECSDSAWGSNDTPRSRVSSITPYAYHPGPAGAAAAGLKIAAAEHAGARVRAGLGGGRGDRGSAGRGEPATVERTRRPPRVLALFQP